MLIISKTNGGLGGALSPATWRVTPPLALALACAASGGRVGEGPEDRRAVGRRGARRWLPLVTLP